MARIPHRWREYVRGCADGAPPALQRRAINLLAEDRESRQRARVKAAPRRERKAEDEAAPTRSEVRAACVSRSGGNCEACGRPSGESLHMDHFWGRAREESVESCWMLCPRCDREKTENRPTRGFWILRFQRHAERHGYREQMAKAGRAFEFHKAKHPEHGRAA